MRHPSQKFFPITEIAEKHGSCQSGGAWRGRQLTGGYVRLRLKRAVILCWWPTYTLPTSALNKSSLEALMQKLPSAMVNDILPEDNVSVSFLDYGGVALLTNS